MSDDAIAAIRRFNRDITRRLGVLSGNFLERGRPFGETRLLYEIGARGSDARQLRARLGLDSGYVSRLLRSLERQGLVKSARSEADARVTSVTLTHAGLAELREINLRSDAFAHSLLLPLSERQRTQLLEAMAATQRLLQAASVRIEPVSAASPLARGCLEAYFREISARFENGFDPDRGVTATPEELTPPAGYFLVAMLDNDAVGCGALKVAGGYGEIKRMWVTRSARGLGIGRRILQSLEAIAHTAGIKCLRLDSNETLAEALNLYRGAGYQEVAPFNDNPYAHRWFEKRMRAGEATSSG